MGRLGTAPFPTLEKKQANSGLEDLPPPAAPPARQQQPLVEPVRAVLPELHPVRAQPVAAPERRKGERPFAEADQDRLVTLLHRLPRIDRPRLRRRPGPRL